jgi:hypothetical protein
VTVTDPARYSVRDPSVTVNSIENCNSNEKLHDALKGELLFSTGAGYMLAVLYACAD